MYLSPSFPSFALLRQSSKDFGWAFAGRASRKDGFDRAGVDHKSASVEPVLNVAFIRRPFQVVKSGVGFVFIFVMDNGKSKWIGNKRLSDQSVYQKGLGFTGLSKFGLGIVVNRSKRHDAGAVVAALDAVDVPTNAFDATEIANFVEPFVILDREPLFSRLTKAVFQRSNDLWEDVLCHGLNVKFALPTFDEKTGDDVSIVSGKFQDARANAANELSSVSKLSTDASNAELVRDFVETIRLRNFFPNLARQIEFFLLNFGEKGFSKMRRAHTNWCSASGKQADPSVVIGKNFSIRDTSHSKQIGDFVPSFVTGNGKPFLIHAKAPSCLLLAIKQYLSKAFANLSQLAVIPSQNMELRRCQSA